MDFNTNVYIRISDFTLLSKTRVSNCGIAKIGREKTESMSEETEKENVDSVKTDKVEYSSQEDGMRKLENKIKNLR